MKRLFRNFATVLCSLLVIVTLAKAAQLKEAHVTQIVSDVKLLPQQAAPRPAAVNDLVRNGTAVRTGTQSRSELTFTDLTITRLGANTIFSFEEGTRTMDLRDGAVLFQVPKGSGGATIRTTAVTAAITGTTGIGEFHPATAGHPHPFSKWLCLEGTFHLILPNGQSVELGPGKMVTTDGKAFSPVLTFNIGQVMETSLLVTGFDTPLASLPLIEIEQANQGGLVTRTPITNTSFLDPSNIIDVVDQGMTAQESPTVTPTPPITPTPSTPTPTPSKFGTLTTIASSDPYVITGGTTITTDPSITTNGVTDFGKIYRGPTNDGPFTMWAFGSISAFDTALNLNTEFFADANNLPIAVFKFQSLSLIGNPTIDTSNGGTNLALVGVDGISSGPPGGTLIFAGLDRLYLGTVNGSINLTSNVSFTNLDLLAIYARGSGSSLTINSPISNIGDLKLAAQGSLQLSNAGSMSVGRFDATAGGNLNGQIGGSLLLNGEFKLDTLALSGTTVASGANVTLNVGSNFTNSSSTDISRLRVKNEDAHIGTGGNISMDVGHNLMTAGDFELSVRNTAGQIDNGGDVTLMVDGSISTGGALSLLVENYNETANSAGHIGTGGNISLAAGGNLTADSASVAINNRGGGMIGSDVNLTINVGGALTTLHDGPDFLGNTASLSVAISSRYDDRLGNMQASEIGGNATLSFHAGSASIAGLVNVTISDSGGSIAGDALLSFDVTHELEISAADPMSGSAAIFEILNDSDIVSPPGGRIEGNATVQLNIGDLALSAGSLRLLIDNQNRIMTGGTIDGDAVVGLEAAAISINQDFAATILNRRVSGATGLHSGSIGGDATINVIADSLSVGGDSNAAILNSNNGSGAGASGGNIGGNAEVTLDISGDIHIGGDASFQIANNESGHIGGHANVVVTTGAAFSANSIDALINNRDGGSIGFGSDMTFEIGGALTTTGDASFVTSNRNDGTGGGIIGANVNLTLNAASASIGGFLITDISPNGGGIVPNAFVNVNVPGNLVATGGAEMDIQNTGFNAFGGPFIGAARINTDAKVNISAGSISSGDFLDVEIDNNGAGHIGRDAIITTTVAHNVSSQTDMYFDLTNQANGGAGAGSIGRNASIILSAASISSGGLLDFELINDAGGDIGGNALVNVHASGGVTAQNDAYFEVLNRLQNSDNEGSIGGDIGGNATNNFSAGGNVTVQGALEFGVLNNDARFLDGAGHIGGNAVITFSAANVSSTNYFNLVINNAQGSIDGNASIDAHATSFSTNNQFFAHILNDGGEIGSGASVSVAATGAISAASDATFEIVNPPGSIGNDATIDVSAANITTGGMLFASIDNSEGGSIGGNAAINMNVSNSATVATDATIQIYGSDSAESAAININGGNYSAGGEFFSVIDGNGTLAFNNASVHADVLKAGVFGTNGVLNIGGGTLSADTTLKLYASGSNGQINFISNVTLGGLSAKILAADSITIFNGVVVTVGNIADENPADVYTNHAHYSADFGGDGTTTGTFAGSGANDPQPLDNAPPFDDPPRPAAAHARPHVSVSPRHTPSSSHAGSPPRPNDRPRIADRRPSGSVIRVNNSDQLLSLLDGTPDANGKITVPPSNSRSGARPANPNAGANASRYVPSNSRPRSYPPNRLP